ncbi:protein kinase [Acrocarpospora phusangensis]|uniref:Protein kinase n=1 Tax=Acrocarpospora phusangensis TaxID=1070424 RepID=A0A919Q9H7_9ACTN|nr:serine/threonine-protein kinase [Acrocarpospora phusangensis]GIH23664.1 protein kinase [Acrocarpospora phusangensis]
MPSAAPRDLGEYRLVSRIGQGGQGEVHRARTASGAEVAVKILHATLSADEGARRRFFREVDLARRVAPFCTARVLDVGVQDNQPYIVSEFVPGASLHQVVRQEGPRTGGGLMRLAVATATALAAIHRAGVVHRDFKPSNVIMGPEGPVVIDFGISRALDHTVTHTGSMGTPGYMAPEQVTSGQVGPEADVFSWAATMVYAATGQAAFRGDSMPVILHALLYGTPDLSDVPDSIRPLLAKCLDKEPGNRPTAADLVRMLTGDVAPSVVPPSTVPPAPPPPTLVSPDSPAAHGQELTQQVRSRSRRTPILVGAAGLLVAAAVLAAVRFWPGTGGEPAASPSTSTTLEASTFGVPVGDPLLVHTDDVRSIAIGRLGGDTVSVSGSDDNTARVVDLAKGVQLTPTLTGHRKWVRSVALGTLDGVPVALTGSDDGSALLWDLRTRERMGQPIAGNPGGIKSVALGDLDGTPIAITAGVDETARIWDLRTREQLGEPLTGHTGTVWAVALTTLNGTPVAVTTGDDGTVRVWDLGTRRPIGDPMTGHTGWVRSIAVGELGGSTIALTGGEDGTARVWDLATGKQLGDPLTGHVSWVWSVALTAIDGRLLALTGGEDDTARVWDLTTRKQVGAPLTGHTDCVWSVAFAELDGEPVAVTGSKDESIRLWRLT